MSQEIKIDLSHYLDYVAPCYHYLFKSDKRYHFLVGSASSGKSYAVAQYILYEMLIRPYHRIVVVRNVYSTIKDSVFKQLISVIKNQGMEDLFTWSDSKTAEPYLICKTNNNELLARGLDDVAKLKSITDVTMFFLEEGTEIDEYRDYLQIDLRLRYKCNYLKLIVACNPTDPEHWIKTEVIDTLQLKSGSTKHKDNADYYYLHTTWKDNIFLSKESITAIQSMANKDEYYNKVYNLGLWCRLDSYSIFNVVKVNERLTQLNNQNYMTGYMTRDMNNNGFIPIDNGYIRLYKAPQKNIPYVISVDTKSTGNDFYACHVINNVTSEQCAVLHISDIMEADVVEQINLLGRYYNDAYCIVERNHSSYIPNKLQEINYPHLYTEGNNAVGVFTQKANKPAMIQNLIEFVENQIDNINDIETLKEMFDFTRNKTSFSAVSGKHDDLIMSLAIALYYSSGQSSQEMKPTPPSRAWLAGYRPTNNVVDEYNDW